MSLLGKKKATVPLRNMWALIKLIYDGGVWELLITAVETNHCYGFRSVSVSRLTLIFHLFLIFLRMFLRRWQCTFQAWPQPKGEYFENS